ncbi:MAG TPA: UTP--glucose-1-phosphate uridylyltransferase [Chloroflexi bacterium]|nr:UTP--glucose-1-phosphate uridylyltransferase [Chloroflexota bacterium]HHW87326.1 UTP--glucose-1-phosphate uridylyltransferase [Chloroflexota bacterium]
MQTAGLSQTFIDNFHYYYNQLVEGATGFITRDEAQPVSDLPNYAMLHAAHRQAGAAALARAVVLKLNGGLGTSMGMDGPKSLLPVKDGLTFLDVIVRQNLHLRATTGARIPLLLMNSFATRAASLAALARYPEFSQDIPHDFLQHMEPKVWKDSLLPAAWPDDPDKEWCPPGHGDIYTALVDSGMLQRLLDAGYEYAFVSNADNLGAVLDPAILGFFAEARIPFLMEVAERTAADRKGGHLARNRSGRLILRESAQCPPDEEAEFQDIQRYRYFNTNNLWLNLRALAELLSAQHDILGLPLIRNEKPIDPSNPATPRVYQLETAMGSAIAIFEGAQALCVPRSRFIPVKKNSDLLVLMSDAYRLNSDYTLTLVEELNSRPPVVTLDDRYYLLYTAMQARFPAGAPSLRRCTRLTVTGDVTFGANVTVVGDVTVAAPPGETRHIVDGATLGAP